jgi:Methyltransferase domain
MDAAEVAAHWEANAETWTRHSRAGYDVYRDALNTPAFLAMLPPVNGLDGLDVGCGEGTNTRKLALLGARMHAVDIAPTLHQTRMREGGGGPAWHRLPRRRRDGPAVSRWLVRLRDGVHVADGYGGSGSSVVRSAARAPPGRLPAILDPAYPCFAPPHRKVLREADGKPRAVEVAGYFEETGSRVETWWFSTLPKEERQGVAPFRVPRFHRTLSSWVAMICHAGLVIQQFGEPCASVEVAESVPVVADTRVAGLYLHIRAIKPRVLTL